MIPSFLVSAARTTTVVVAMATFAPFAAAADLTLLCAGAMRGPISEVLAKRDPALPHVTATFGTAGAIRERVAKGERFDVLIAPSDVAFDLMKEHLIDLSSRRALGTTEIGVAVKSDAPMPDIGTPLALRATLLAARKVVIVDPTKGTSGRLMEAIFREMQIENEMRDKLIKVDGGNVTEAVARGEADLGFQQVSEILPVAGVKLVGVLPADLKRPTRYDVALMTSSTQKKAALDLLAELTSPASRAVISKSGFTAAR